MQYLYNDTDSSINFAPYLQIINAIIFESHTDVIVNELFIVSFQDAKNRLDGRISLAINNTSAITQSLLLDEGKVHLIVINEDLCNGMDLIAIILHEMGHILNEFGTEITPLQAWEKNISNWSELNREIKLNNEFSADYYAKKYGYQNSLIENLQMSLGKGYDDEELNRRIVNLKSEEIFNLNRLRKHSI